MSWLGAPTLPTGAGGATGTATLRHRTRTAAASVENGASSSTTLPAPARPRGRRRSKNAPSAHASSSANSGSPHNAYAKGARGVVQAAFRQFGEHCARNQIRTLIIDCLVMTNLFYPSFAMFLERRFDQPVAGPALAPVPGDAESIAKSRGALSFFTTPLSQTFFPPPPPLLPNVEWGPWWASEAGADASWVPVSTAGPSSDLSVELLRVAWADVGDVLDGEHDMEWTPRDDQIVAAVRSLAEGWEKDGPAGARCVRHLADHDGVAVPAGPCYLLTPHESSIPGTTALSELWYPTDGDSAVTSQEVYHGLIVPFHKPSNSSAFASAWRSSLADALAPLGAEVFTETYTGGKNVQCSTLVSFSSSPRPRPPVVVSSTPPYFVLVGYAVLFTALLMQLSSASKVHSRFGLAFTGIVQLCCSGVMSFSILSLCGWNGWGLSKNEAILPTYALPFVVVVVGAENMSAMTKAVFAVPFTYSVPVRIGIGLSKVGTTIALTSLIDLTLLGLVWLCVHLPPVREFCVFAAVVIFTDWFMLNTFFLTVLSIDAQRLELADVLSSNGALASNEAKRREEDEARHRRTKSTRFSWRSVLRARTVKSGSLILLLVSLGVLYYYTERGRTSFTTPATFYGYTPTSTSSLAPSARPTMFATTGTDLSSLSVSEALWRSINPQGLGSVRMTMLPSSIVVLPRLGHSLLPADLHNLLVPRTRWMPRLDPIWYYIKVGLAPQLLTCVVLYCVLAYLLKDSELLAAQRNRLGRGREANASDEETDTEVRPRRTTLTLSAGVSMLPASHESDVDVLASSSDGKLAVSVGVDNSVCFWRFTDDERVSGTREMVSTEFIPAGDPIVGAAVSGDRHCIAVATRGGVVQLWSTPDDRKTEVLGPVSVGCGDDRVTAIAFDDSPSGVDDPFTASPVGRERPQGRPTLLVALGNGAIRAIGVGNRVIDIAPPASADASCRVDLLASDAGPIAIVGGPDRTTMWRKEHGEWSSTPLLSTCESTDRVLAVACGLVDWQRPTDIVVVGRRSGRIEVFDADGEPMAAVFGQVGEPVRDIAVAAPSVTRCSTCDSKTSDGFFVISSTGTNVYVDRVVPRGADSFCRCPPLPRRASAIEDTRSSQLSQLGVASAVSLRGSPLVLPPSPARARSTSGGLSGTASHGTSPVKASALAPPASNGEFPLSSHGARRLSGWRDADDARRPPSPLDRQGSSYTALSTLSMATADDSGNPSPGTRMPWADADVVPLGAVVATDGGWAVLGNDLVGVRRAGAGIDDSQWEFWAVDLAAPWNGTSLLVDNANLDVLERRARAGTSPRHGTHLPLPPGTPPPPSADGEMPMRARRAERILSLNGRASFPSSVGSFSVATHPPLGYVAVRPFSAAGPRAVLAGFGNRVGVITLPAAPQRTRQSTTAHNLLPRQTPAFNFSLSTPRVVTPRRQQFPSAPPPPRRADGNGVIGSPGVALSVSPNKNQ